MTLRLTFFIVTVLVTQAASAQLFGSQQVISTLAPIALSVHAEDLDGDGDLDVLSASESDNKIAWYENLGGGVFGSQQIISTLQVAPYSVYSSDLDNDGDMDVLAASRDDDMLAWYDNLGGGVFGSLHVISTLVNGVNSVHSDDLDGDGDMDVLSASQFDDKIAWYENLGGGNFGTQQIISTQSNVAVDVYSADLDGDGDKDVLSASISDDEISWYVNLGGGIFGAQQIISTQANGANGVYAADLDGDGDTDVLSSSGYDDKIAWYANLGGGNFGAQQIITDLYAYAASSVYSADLDQDGDMDVLSSSCNDDKIAWYENLGEGNFGAQQIITNLYAYPASANGASSVYAADLDSDGDLDVLSASRFDDKIAWYENLSGFGCTDQSACNYDPDALTENGSCCYGICGCMNPLAANYLETATCDNATCEFRINGTVFFDENENGDMDVNEYGLPFQTVVLQETGQAYITNDQGNFITTTSHEQVASFELINTVTFPYNTTTSPQVFNPNFNLSTQRMFGVSNAMPMFGIGVDFYPDGLSFLCNDYTNFNICFRNLGNVPIDGIIELEYDELFQGYQEVTTVDSVIGNTVYMSYENLLPGQMFIYNIELLTPTVDHIGEYVTNFARVYGYYDGNQVAYGERERTTEIACAYDPNDKQAFPLGYTDEHWLLQETEQEFVIRFQNTGNAPAQNIRIQDTLDVNFDIESFRVIANSHSVMTTIDPETRLIDFYFENIQLPDSVNNEPASHGVISYIITPLPNLPVGTVLENTAYIYFDNNDPIITNTTWTTIHECGGESAFESGTALVCNEPQVNFESSYEFVEQYSWQVDGVAAGVNSQLLLSSLDQLNYEVTLTATNPLCTETNTLNYQVPDIASIDPCIADLNCDGFRNTQDLLVMISDFGCFSNCQADFDDNGIVNVVDLFIFVSLFDLSCWE